MAIPMKNFNSTRKKKKCTHSRALEHKAPVASPPLTWNWSWLRMGLAPYGLRYIYTSIHPSIHATSNGHFNSLSSLLQFSAIACLLLMSWYEFGMTRPGKDREEIYLLDNDRAWQGSRRDLFAYYCLCFVVHLLFILLLGCDVAPFLFITTKKRR